jgi:FkbM family methyltransferase
MNPFIALVLGFVVQLLPEALASHGLKEKLIAASFMHPELYQCIKATPNSQYDGNLNEIKKSQSHEDTWLWEKIYSTLPLADVMGGTFLEIGGYTGVDLSNSFFFEKKYDWRGLLVEGHPANQKILRSNQQIRSNSVIATAAICSLDANDNPGSVNFTTGGGPVGAIASEAHQKFLEYWHKNEGTLQVSCLPLQLLLESTGLIDIDLFSLDVEGAELFVLKTIDFRITNIHVILVELDGGNPTKDTAVRNLLATEGFVNAEKTLGSVRSACDNINFGCTSNEVYINPYYLERKRARHHFFGQVNRYYQYGTSLPCV